MGAVVLAVRQVDGKSALPVICVTYLIQITLGAQLRALDAYTNVFFVGLRGAGQFRQ